MKPPRHCPVCGSLLLYYQKHYCSKACYGIATRSDKYVERARPNDIKFKPVKRVTDIEQMQVNLDIDRRGNLNLECRILKPGDPGFAEVAKQITPLNRIKRTERIIGYLGSVDNVY